MELIHSLLEWLRGLCPWLETLAGGDLFAFYGVVFAVVFAETGLVVTPFLPGDSLLFFLGALAAHRESPLSLPLLFGLLSVAAVLGDAINYAIGYRLGPAVFRFER